LPATTIQVPKSLHSKGSAFWSQKNIGRAVRMANCQITTSFEFSKQYLLVLQDAPTFKSFEKIDGENDEWLRYVKANATQE
jgi:hypothetical protein